MPRRISFRGKELLCARDCLAKMHGAAFAIHSDAFRARTQKEMQATDEGRHRVREARGRIDVHNRDIHEERETKRVKHDEVQEKASSSGGAPCYGPESKDMDIKEEHPKGKREYACEQAKEHVKRTKRMEHHEDGDEDMVLELACTDDFDEYGELTADSEQELKDVEDKVWWADETDEPEFRDDRTGKPLHPVKVRAAREEEL